jgi:hypothetical protein
MGQHSQMELFHYLTESQREELKAVATIRTGTVCACGRAKAPQYAQCPKCSRHVGPYVVVQSPSGDYVEVGGLESAESLLQRNGNSTVQV